MSVTRDQLLGYQPDIKPIEVRGLGTVYVRSLTGEDQHTIRTYAKNQPDDEVGVLVKGIIGGVCGEDGEPLFDGGDTGQLRKMPIGVLTKLGEAVWKQSGLDDEEADAIEGKSETTES